MSDHRSGEIEVEVRVVLRYPIPADIAERERLYGTSDLGQCVQIDLDNDPVEFFLDSTLVSVETADSGEQEPLIERRLREALDIATAALRAQRYDLHVDDGRPCGTCSRASNALNTADAIRIWHDDKRARSGSSEVQL